MRTTKEELHHYIEEDNMDVTCISETRMNSLVMNLLDIYYEELTSNAGEGEADYVFDYYSDKLHTTIVIRYEDYHQLEYRENWGYCFSFEDEDKLFEFIEKLCDTRDSLEEQIRDNFIS